MSLFSMIEIRSKINEDKDELEARIKRVYYK